MRKTIIQELVEHKTKFYINRYTVNCIRFNEHLIWQGVVYCKYGMVDIRQSLLYYKNKFMISLRIMKGRKVIDTHLFRKNAYTESYLATIATKWAKYLSEQSND